MSDLTDDDLELACTVSDRLQTLNHRAYIDREALALADRLQRAAIEVKRHRAAVRADRERVRAAVVTAVDATAVENVDGGRSSWTGKFVDAIADHVADALASPAPAPTAARVSAERVAHMRSEIATARSLCEERVHSDEAYRMRNIKLGASVPGLLDMAEELLAAAHRKAP
jgi:hypothetical protein